MRYIVHHEPPRPATVTCSAGASADTCSTGARSSVLLQRLKALRLLAVQNAKKAHEPFELAGDSPCQARDIHPQLLLESAH